MKTTLFAILLFTVSTPFDLQLYDTDSPNSFLYSLLGLLLIGVVHTVYAVKQVQKETQMKSL